MKKFLLTERMVYENVEKALGEGVTEMMVQQTCFGFSCDSCELNQFKSCVKKIDEMKTKVLRKNKLKKLLDK